MDLEDGLDPGDVVNDEMETIEAEAVEREEESCDWCTITPSKDDTKREDQFHMEGRGMTVYVMDLEDGLDPGDVVNDELETIEAEAVEREEESCKPEKMDTKPASMEKMTGWSRFK